MVMAAVVVVQVTNLVVAMAATVSNVICLESARLPHRVPLTVIIIGAVVAVVMQMVSEDLAAVAEQAPAVHHGTDLVMQMVSTQPDRSEEDPGSPVII